MFQPARKFLFLAAGIAPGMLHEFNPIEHLRYIFQGLVVILTSCFAGLAAGYAILVTFHSLSAAVLLGILWAITIFILNVLLLISIKKTGSFFVRLALVAVRIFFAVLLGLIIAKPLELKIFESDILAHIKGSRLEKQINSLKEANEQRKQSLADIENQKRENISLAKEINATVSPAEFLRLGRDARRIRRENARNLEATYKKREKEITVTEQALVRVINEDNNNLRCLEEVRRAFQQSGKLDPNAAVAALNKNQAQAAENKDNKKDNKSPVAPNGDDTQRYDCQSYLSIMLQQEESPSFLERLIAFDEMQGGGATKELLALFKTETYAQPVSPGTSSLRQSNGGNSVSGNGGRASNLSSAPQVNRANYNNNRGSTEIPLTAQTSSANLNSAAAEQIQLSGDAAEAANQKRVRERTIAQSALFITILFVFLEITPIMLKLLFQKGHYDKRLSVIENKGVKRVTDAERIVADFNNALKEIADKQIQTFANWNPNSNGESTKVLDLVGFQHFELRYNYENGGQIELVYPEKMNFFDSFKISDSEQERITVLIQLLEKTRELAQTEHISKEVTQAIRNALQQIEKLITPQAYTREVNLKIADELFQLTEVLRKQALKTK